jgi:predicted nucleic acid-binding protein
MITAIDTNVLLDILAPDPIYFAQSSLAVEASASAGSLVICDLVYSELCVNFQNRSDCDRFLEENDIQVEGLTREANFLASRLWRSYRQVGGKRTRILTDFLVGAHA